MVLESRNEQSLKGYDNVPIYATTPTNVDQSELFPSCESVKTLDEFINLEPEPIPRPMLQHYLWTLVEGTYIGSYLKRSQNPPRTIERSVSVPLSQLLTRNDGNRSFLSDTENPQYANDVLCSEYQKFYISVISLLRNDSVYSIENALDKITTEDKLQPILPYFLQFIMGKITTSLHSPLEMCVLIRFAIALALNRSIYLGIYVHSFLKIAFAGLTSLSLTDSICDDDLTIRNFSAELLRIICERCEHCFPSVKDSIFNALVRILFNPNVTINSHYGALIGITKIGEPYTERIIPHIHSYLRFIKKNKQKLRERKTINEIIKITEQLCSKQKNNKTLLVNKMM
ncbi:transcription initiation factor TFIID subunit 6-like [Histomonas meleagridis]|uniref:transcription initiation factor TFIID subunit 6-like n=1 Tax=Histomonas meleagridis TaxID=135588 RepID=UPI0035593773|nr:transcription initiation factor TFIID subunit 6-like [Histomonas meleagridis]KAH0806330.1 transcription initiation factor TFIID subunit 6-like [Histomonas meleagridis]